jgi:hypothetical protein
VEEETVIEDIPAFDTLDDGWEEAILFAPQVELEIEEEELEILLPKPTVTEALKSLQILSDFTTAFEFYNNFRILQQLSSWMKSLHCCHKCANIL